MFRSKLHLVVFLNGIFETCSGRRSLTQKPLKTSDPLATYFTYRIFHKIGILFSSLVINDRNVMK